jgi:hypothetical protein
MQDCKSEEWWKIYAELNKMKHNRPRSQAAVTHKMHQHKNTQSNYPTILVQSWIPVWSH